MLEQQSQTMEAPGKTMQCFSVLLQALHQEQAFLLKAECSSSIHADRQ